MIDLTYKKCTINDLKLLLNLSRHTFITAFQEMNNPEDFKMYVEKAFNEKTIKEQLKNKKAHFYFVYADAELAGYFKLNEWEAQTDLHDPESIELERIYLGKQYQGKQLGTRVLQEVIGLSKKMGGKYIWLGVWEHNPGAIRFYKRMGFKKFAEHPYVLGTDVQTDWLMKRTLNGI